MTCDIETLCTLISMELSRFPHAGNHWEICDPRFPSQIGIKLEQVSDNYIPVDAAKFYQWLKTPGLSWADVVAMVTRKRKQLHQHKKQHQ